MMEMIVVSLLSYISCAIMCVLTLQPEGFEGSLVGCIGSRPLELHELREHNPHVSSPRYLPRRAFRLASYFGDVILSMRKS